MEKIMEQTKQATILVVDDDDASRKLLKKMLSVEGHAVRTAASGEEALASVVEQLPDLILLDILMPGIDGFEVTRRLKADARSHPVPIILVTSMDDRESRLKGLEAGAEELLNKPVDRAELLVRVRNLLKLKEYQDFLADHNRILEEQVAARTAKLRESEERSRLIAETITEVFWMTDAQIGKMFYISPAYERIWGRSLQSLYENPRSFIEAIHPDDLARMLAVFELQKTGQPFDHEYRITKPDGTLRWIWDRGYPIHEPTGEVLRYAGIAQDITERKQTEIKLQLFRQLLDHSRDGIAIVDPGTSRFLDVNEALCNHLGYTRDELLQRGVLDIQTDIPDVAAWQAHQQELRKQGAALMELESLHKDGSRSSDEISIQYAALDNHDFVIAVVRDITERKRTEARLAEHIQELRRWHEITSGREKRILSIKHEVNELLAKAGQPPRYPSAELPYKKEE